MRERGPNSQTWRDVIWLSMITGDIINGQKIPEHRIRLTSKGELMLEKKDAL
jgi:hypothetical protein